MVKSIKNVIIQLKKMNQAVTSLNIKFNDGIYLSSDLMRVNSQVVKRETLYNNY